MSDSNAALHSQHRSGQLPGLLVRVYEAMRKAADPLSVIPHHLPSAPEGRTIVVGAGKASAAMALAVEKHLLGQLSGVVVVPRGAVLPLKIIQQVEASHPIPDVSSVRAGHRLMEAVTGLRSSDLVLALISGGGSSLCALPAQGVSLQEKRIITESLLLQGATISELNVVRKHLSAIKGGRLAVRAYPAPVVSLLISDIPGDDPGLIASSPTLPDATTCADALDVLERYSVEVSAAVKEALVSNRLESPKPSDSRFGRNRYQIVASAQDGLEAAARQGRDEGWQVHILSDSMQGEARDVALAHAAIARQVQRRSQPFSPPCLILSGGEATVNVKGSGRGGRNTEFALVMALALQGQRGIHALSAGTDGLDGSGSAAGAWIGPETLEQGRAVGLDGLTSLQNNDSFTYFDAIGSTIVTGPTHTNINDFRAVMVESIST